ncbi:Floricaula/leafy-like protein [Trichinella spiralis]|uniref:Floricaula/leafy-like protein n=1 Tax=Trichinella spiralis TaxID=6334 RepID=A0ABR3K2C7_TRISP
MRGKQADETQEDSSDSEFAITPFEMNIELPITYTTNLKIDSIKNSHRRCSDLITSLKNGNSAELGEVVQMAESGLEALADFTFQCANCWLELIQSLNATKAPLCASKLANIVSGMCMEVQTFVSDLNIEILKCTTKEVEAQVCATEVFLQANRSCSLIHEAYNYVLPYMQWLHLKDVLN